ncbi:hypothetical protein A3715_14055 [Oleiphilus sp. HI0009]|nr:hypothetical protein A3715_14055 [Oleiphilus sp. HI0009]
MDIKAVNILPYSTLATRLVENQQRSATLKLVGYDLEKHDVLEQILEESKPPLDKTLSKRHFLIKTPFRYPPLEYGSRFGRKHESGVFYASLSKDALFSEVAFYRFIFINDMKEPIKDSVTTEHTIFDVRITTDSALFLDEEPFDQSKNIWTDPVNYSKCQQIGSKARSLGIEVIRSLSARNKSGGRNVAVINHKAIKGSPKNLKAIRCTVTEDKCIFLNMHTNERFNYNIDNFIVNGVLPRPSQ